MEDPKKFAQTCLQEYLRIVNEYSYATKGPVVGTSSQFREAQ